jgi:hypothetical protein
MWSIAQYSCRDLHPDYEYIVYLYVGDINSSYGQMRQVGNSSRMNIPGF